MTSTINIKPNTFYRNKSLDDDVAVMPTYGDAYIGVGTTIDFKSSPDSTYYLGESTIITENEYPFNAGTISEMYLSLYANTLTQTNPQTQPYVDVYNMASHLDFTEGNLTLIDNDDGTGPITAYVSAYDFGTSWLTEDFDGTNKSFSNAPIRVSPPGSTRMEDSSVLLITLGDYVDAIMKTHTSHSTDVRTGWLNWHNMVEETKQGLDWGSSKVAEGAYYVVEAIPRVTAWGQRNWARLKGSAMGDAAKPDDDFGLTSNEMLTQMLKDATGLRSPITLSKSSNGLFYMRGGVEFSKNLEGRVKWMVEDFITEGHSRSWWLEKGAYSTSNIISTQSFEYENFTENYIDTANTDNTIFSQIYQRGNARDIKVETIGSSGDNEDFLAYVTAHLVKDDKATEGNALEFKLSWENYAGSSSGDVALDTANAFGRNTTRTPGEGHPLPQCIFTTITDVPMPTLFDVTTPVHTSSCAPEFEFKIKIHNMPTLPYASTSATNKREISRSFSFILDYTTVASGNTDPGITENLGDILIPGGPEVRVVINFCKINEGNNIDVVGRLQNDTADSGLSTTINRNGGGVSSMPAYYHILPADIGGGYHTQVPEGEWITARLKFNDEVTASGSWSSGSTGLLLYFPELLDENGQMKFINVYSPWPIGRNGYWPGQWHFWANNMRSINEVPTTDDDTHINNRYGAVDNVPNDDKIVKVSLDRLSFYGWNSITKNCTNNLQNGMGQLIKIPNVMGIPVASTNTQISVSATGTAADPIADNYYGGLNNTIASYFSLGYDNSGTAHAGVQKHKILFNDFSATDTLNIQPIPDAHLLGGYFTSGNYTVHSDWFNNLSVGVSDTDNIRTGGVDNYMDNFTQKGMIGVSSSFAGWVKSGNPYVAARILTVSTDGTQITVDNANIFDTDLDQEFVVEAVGGRGICEAGYNRYTYSDYLLGSGSVGYLPTNTLTQSKTRQSNTIYLNTSILYDDEGNRLGAPFRLDADWTDADVGPAYFSRNSQIIISPKKYWVNMAIGNCVSRTATGSNAALATWTSPRNSGSGYAEHLFHSFDMSSSTGTGSGAVLTALVLSGKVEMADSFITLVSGGTGYVPGERIHFSSSTGLNSSAYVTVDGITNGWADWYGQASGGYAIPLSPRGYNTVVSVSGGSTLGTTFNEFLYNDGIYTNRWGLDYKSAASMTVNNTIDYGLGAMQEQNANGEMEQSSYSLGSSRGYIQRDFLLSGQNYINLTPYPRTVRPKSGEDFNFMMIPTFMESREGFYDVNFDTAEGTNEALLIYGIRNPISPITDFKVSPILSKGGEWPSTTNVSLSWAEESRNNNTWYRLLFVDSQQISNKYHNINFWAPLNEVGNTYGYYTSDIDTTATAFSNSGNVSSSVQGFSGYGSYYNGSNYLIQSGTTVLAADLSRWSFLAHCKPAHTSGTIFDVANNLDSSGVSQFTVALSSSRIVVTHASSSTTLTSVNSYDCDGIQPIATAVTFDKNIPDNNWKLYVNGKLEDTDDYTAANINVSGGLCVGALARTYFTGVAPFFTGFIEEITSHSGTTLYLPPNLNNYILDTKGYDDLTTGSTNTSINYTARLFTVDGNNIRGKGPADVARSDTASWKVTGI